jgi:hypothetical protein
MVLTKTNEAPPGIRQGRHAGLGQLKISELVDLGQTPPCVEVDVAKRREDVFWSAS